MMVPVFVHLDCLLIMTFLSHGKAGNDLNHESHHSSYSKGNLKDHKRLWKKSKYRNTHNDWNCHCTCSCECPAIQPSEYPSSPSPSCLSSSPSFSPSRLSTSTQDPTEIPTISQHPTRNGPTLPSLIPTTNSSHFPKVSVSPSFDPTTASIPTIQSQLPSQSSSNTPTSSNTNFPTKNEPVYLIPLVMNMRGASRGEVIPFSGSNVEIQCYNVSLYTLETVAKIGVANTCLTISINSLQEVQLIMETTSFQLPFGNFTSTIAPTLVFTNETSPAYVSSTGSKGRPNRTISRGEGLYENVSGTARVSGFLDGNFTDASFYFDYIYVVDFDNPI